MLKDKPINIADTNMALFGTDIEKKIKLYAAQTEAAWNGIGQEEGMKIWCVLGRPKNLLASGESRSSRLWSGLARPTVNSIMETAIFVSKL
jgi:hypothetical protein